MAETQGMTSQPTVFASVWRYRWLVLLIAIAFAALGWLYASQTSEWTAQATLSVQDPRSSNVFDQAFPDTPERYVEAQAAILGSRSVARRSVEIASLEDPPVVVSVSGVVSNLGIATSDSSDIVTLIYNAPTQREAIAVVNSVAAAYQEIGRASADTSFTNAVSELDVSIAELSVSVTVVEEELSRRQAAVLASLAESPTRIERELLLDTLVIELLELQPPSSSASAERIAAFNNELAILNIRIERLSGDLDQERAEALAAEANDPARAALVRQRDEAQQRVTDLQARRDQLAVDADLVSNGVIFFSPAEIAYPSSAGLYVAIGFLLGLALGSGLAVWLSSTNQRFTSRTQPEALLGARLLADVPNFREERLSTKLPVFDDPTSASAEAFRFISASVVLQQQWPAREDGASNFGSVITLSSGVHEGKTVVTANTALAAAREGNRVVVLDADFGNQQLTGVLAGDSSPSIGMIEVVTGDATLADAVTDIPVDGSGVVHLLSRGSGGMQGPDFFAADGTAALFASLSELYDLVLIDSPPLLRVAYATTLARLADRAMIVVAHGQPISDVEELRNQMDLVGTQEVGYVYNFAPLRAEMTLSAGSMADTLGPGSQQTSARQV
ncbi:MAG: Wzz/FepE/Etk N-terminal domain-containing protein [Acidimicrobiia bacterium]